MTGGQLGVVKRLHDLLPHLGLDAEHLHVLPLECPAHLQESDLQAWSYASEFTPLVQHLLQLRPPGRCLSIAVCGAEADNVARAHTAVQLAVGFNQHGLKTVIVDAELERPGLAGLVADPHQEGLVDMVRFGRSCRALLRQPVPDGPAVLGVGSFPVDGSVPFAGDAWLGIVHRIALHAEVALFPAPLLVRGDVNGLLRSVEQVLYVPPAAVTEATERDVERLRRSAARVAGVVLCAPVEARPAPARAAAGPERTSEPVAEVVHLLEEPPAAEEFGFIELPPADAPPVRTTLGDAIAAEPLVTPEPESPLAFEPELEAPAFHRERQSRTSSFDSEPSVPEAFEAEPAGSASGFDAAGGAVPRPTQASRAFPPPPAWGEGAGEAGPETSPLADSDLDFEPVGVAGEAKGRGGRHESASRSAATRSAEEANLLRRQLRLDGADFSYSEGKRYSRLPLFLFLALVITIGGFLGWAFWSQGEINRRARQILAGGGEEPAQTSDGEKKPGDVVPPKEPTPDDEAAAAGADKQPSSGSATGEKTPAPGAGSEQNPPPQGGTTGGSGASTGPPPAGTQTGGGRPTGTESPPKSTEGGSETPTVTQKPPAEPPATSGGGGPGVGSATTMYAVHVASYRKLEQANQDLANLRKHGYEGRAVRTDLESKGIWYRVYVGSYPTKEAAEQARAVIVKLPGYDAFAQVRRIAVP